MSKTFNKVMKSIGDNFIQEGRRFLFDGLAMPINSDITIIKQEVLEKVKCIDFRDTDSELKYTTLLVKNHILPKYSPNIIVYESASQYETKTPSLAQRLSLFTHCLQFIFTNGFKFAEHVLSLLRPNFWVMFAIILYYVFLGIQFDVSDLSILYTLLSSIICAAAIAWFSSLFMAKLTFQDTLFLCLHPIYKLSKLFEKFSTLNNLLKKIFKTKINFSLFKMF